MAKGMALNIGLNAVDPRHYQGWSGELNACEADANDMADIAAEGKFKVQKLLTKSATRKATLAGLEKAAKALKAGDMFFLTYSGHGGQVPDKNDDEPDAQDETWCLYDGELIDDELYTELGRFEPGVRIFVLSDSCHSGTVTKAMFYAMRAGTAMATELAAGGSARPPAYRAMPRDVALRTYRAHKKMYDGLQKAVEPDAEKDVTGVRDPHLRLPGQPAFSRRPVQRPLHEPSVAGVERRPVRGRVSKVPPVDHQRHAARSDAQLLHDRRINRNL